MSSESPSATTRQQQQQELLRKSLDQAYAAIHQLREENLDIDVDETIQQKMALLQEDIHFLEHKQKEDEHPQVRDEVEQEEADDVVPQAEQQQQRNLEQGPYGSTMTGFTADLSMDDFMDSDEDDHAKPTQAEEAVMDAVVNVVPIKKLAAAPESATQLEEERRQQQPHKPSQDSATTASTVASSASKAPSPPPLRRRENIFQRAARNMARYPKTHFWVAFLAALTISVVGFVVGKFSVVAENAGWQSRGTLLANRQTQLMMANEFEDELRTGKAQVWDTLTTQIQRGWQEDDNVKGEGRRLMMDNGRTGTSPAVWFDGGFAVQQNEQERIRTATTSALAQPQIFHNLIQHYQNLRRSHNSSSSSSHNNNSNSNNRKLQQVLQLLQSRRHNRFLEEEDTGGDDDGVFANFGEEDTEEGGNGLADLSEDELEDLVKKCVQLSNPETNADCDPFKEIDLDMSQKETIELIDDCLGNPLDSKCVALIEIYEDMGGGDGENRPVLSLDDFDCDLEYFTDGSMFNASRLWPVWKVQSTRMSSAVDPTVLRVLCNSEAETQKILEDNGLCILGCNNNQNCLPPYSLVFLVRLLLSMELGTFEMMNVDCNEMMDAYTRQAKMFPTEVENDLLECAAALETVAFADLEDGLPSECPPGFFPSMVDSLFTESGDVRYTSSIFATEDDDETLEAMYELSDTFARGDPSIVQGAYDTKWEDFANLLANGAVNSDMLLATGSAFITTMAMLIHTRSPFLTIVGLVQIMLSFPLAYCTYRFLGGLTFFVSIMPSKQSCMW